MIVCNSSSACRRIQFSANIRPELACHAVERAVDRFSLWCKLRLSHKIACSKYSIATLFLSESEAAS